MITLVLGGSGSGKSEFAEDYVVGKGSLPRYYIATMVPMDEECEKKVLRHRDMRKEKQFQTVERYTHVGDLSFEEEGIILLDCMSNLLANELYRKEGRNKNTAHIIVSDLVTLASKAKELVIVSNDVFCEGKEYDAFTMQYLDCFASVHRELAKVADQVVEVVYGIPIYEKGGTGHETTCK